MATSDLGLVQTIDGFSHGIAIRIASTAYRRSDMGLLQALCSGSTDTDCLAIVNRRAWFAVISAMFKALITRLAVMLSPKPAHHLTVECIKPQSSRDSAQVDM